MKPAGQIISCVAITILLSISAQADDLAVSGNPYSPIVARNIFGLIPIPTNPPVAEPPANPPPKITPNGIMSLFGKLQVLFKVAVPPKPGQPPKDQSYVMGEGERQDDIEVTKIDEKAAIITFNNHGTVQELPLANAPNLTTPASGVVPAFNPGTGRIPAPGVLPAPSMGFNGRSGRGRPPGNGGNISSSAATTPATTTSNNNVQDNEILSPEAQVIVLEAQRAKWKEEGNPAASIIPPTPITPKEGEGQ